MHTGKRARNIDLDFIKGVAILAVVFYHVGLLPFGYLGVDIFLVINGYFITHGMLSRFNAKTFGYTAYLKQKLLRLWPLVVLAALVSIVIGYNTMLPDDYENLCQSVVASDIFANNILSTITAGNYWDVLNSHKPLMHMWYVGLLMQCYVIFPLIVYAIYKLGRNIARNLLIVLAIVFALPYLVPYFPTALKFYQLPFRLFEFLIGSIVAVYIPQVKAIKNARLLYWILTAMLLALCCISIDIDNDYKVIIISIITGLTVLVSVSSYSAHKTQANILYVILGTIGMMSYSVFIWHQVIIAFYKYMVNPYMQLADYLILAVIIAAVSLLSYYGIERYLSKIRDNKSANRVLALTFVMAVISSASGLYYYMRAGVTRDVPELGISTDNIRRGMHAEYCDRVYNMDQDFKDDGRVKVLSIGNSFARDWVNVMLESDIADSLDISYIYVYDLVGDKDDIYARRISEADVVCINVSPDYIQGEVAEALAKHDNVLGIGTKSFGESNGYVYARRNSKDYYQTHVPMTEKVIVQYEYDKRHWRDRYIDFIAPVADAQGRMPVFTDDSMYISQDCKHLTQAGARYYARILDLKGILLK